MRPLTTLLVAVIIICLVIIAAVSFHSVEEVHHLKSFYPQTFTVEEAFYASMVEFIKIHIISLPLMVVILLSAFLLWVFRKR